MKLRSENRRPNSIRRTKTKIGQKSTAGVWSPRFFGSSLFPLLRPQPAQTSGHAKIRGTEGGRRA